MTTGGGGASGPAVATHRREPPGTLDLTERAGDLPHKSFKNPPSPTSSITFTQTATVFFHAYPDLNILTPAYSPPLPPPLA